MKTFLFMLVAGVVALIGGAIIFDKWVHQPLPIDTMVTVELPRGAGSGFLAARLETLNVTKYPLLMRLAARIYGYDYKLKAGEYVIESGMSVKDIFDKISQGKVALHKITLPEGLTTVQMLMMIEDNNLLAGEITEQVLEGELLPETYTFAKGSSRDDIIRTAKKAMDNALNKAWNSRVDGLPLNSPEELRILASIIEKETGIGDERQLVASVFVNRLNINMLLQTDPTVIYAITQGREDLDRALTRKDLKIDSPYNTYKYKGLPPTAICNPGVEALQAAAHPHDTPYFYFVANGRGGHNFATTLAEHNRNVRDWVRSRMR